MKIKNQKTKIKNIINFLLIFGLILPIPSTSSGLALSEVEVPIPSISSGLALSEVEVPIPSISSGLALSEVEVPSFIFAQNQFQQIQPPETLGEAKEMGEKFSQEAKEKLPGILEKLWKEEAMPVWSKMWDWAKNWWRETIWPWIGEFFQKKIKPSLEEEIEKRKPIIKEEFEKEKQEFKKEAPEVGKSLWERFKEIIK